MKALRSNLKGFDLEGVSTPDFKGFDYICRDLVCRDLNIRFEDVSGKLSVYEVLVDQEPCCMDCPGWRGLPLGAPQDDVSRLMGLGILWKRFWDS